MFGRLKKQMPTRFRMTCKVSRPFFPPSLCLLSSSQTSFSAACLSSHRAPGENRLPLHGPRTEFPRCVLFGSASNGIAPGARVPPWTRLSVRAAAGRVLCRDDFPPLLPPPPPPSALPSLLHLGSSGATVGHSGVGGDLPLRAWTRVPPPWQAGAVGRWGQFTSRWWGGVAL